MRFNYASALIVGLLQCSDAVRITVRAVADRSVSLTLIGANGQTATGSASWQTSSEITSIERSIDVPAGTQVNAAFDVSDMNDSSGPSASFLASIFVDGQPFAVTGDGSNWLASASASTGYKTATFSPDLNAWTPLTQKCAPTGGFASHVKNPQGMMTQNGAQPEPVWFPTCGSRGNTFYVVRRFAAPAEKSASNPANTLTIDGVDSLSPSEPSYVDWSFKLPRVPQGTVYVQLKSTETIRYDKCQLTFTPSNYNVAQTVRVFINEQTVRSSYPGSPSQQHLIEARLYSYDDISFDELSFNKLLTRNYRTAGSAYVWGDPHIVSFDGASYDFHGRDGNTHRYLESPETSIQMRHYVCNKGDARNIITCVNSLTIRHREAVMVMEIPSTFTASTTPTTDLNIYSPAGDMTSTSTSAGVVASDPNGRILVQRIGGNRAIITLQDGLIVDAQFYFWYFKSTQSAADRLDPVITIGPKYYGNIYVKAPGKYFRRTHPSTTVEADKALFGFWDGSSPNDVPSATWFASFGSQLFSITPGQEMSICKASCSALVNHAQLFEASMSGSVCSFAKPAKPTATPVNFVPPEGDNTGSDEDYTIVPVSYTTTLANGNVVVSTSTTRILKPTAAASNNNDVSPGDVTIIAASGAAFAGLIALGGAGYLIQRRRHAVQEIAEVTEVAFTMSIAGDASAYAGASFVENPLYEKASDDSEENTGADNFSTISSIMSAGGDNMTGFSTIKSLGTLGNGLDSIRVGSIRTGSQSGSQRNSLFGTQRGASQYGTVNSAFTQLSDEYENEIQTTQSAGFTEMSQ